MRGIVFAVVASFVLMGTSFSFGQDAGMSEPGMGAEMEMDASGAQWILGEVISVDTQKNEVLVKYLDYETEQEKEIAIMADNNTAYENVKSLAELKPKDTVSVDYVAGADGKNVAKNISVEAPEPIADPEGKVGPPSPVPMGTGSPATKE